MDVSVGGKYIHTQAGRQAGNFLEQKKIKASSLISLL